jgi:hypothetical protein
MESSVFSPNLVWCPKCKHQFENNMINGLALIEAVNRIDSRKRMYSKLALDDIERHIREGTLTQARAKKIIFDNFSDFYRSVQTILGMGNEVE